MRVLRAPGLEWIKPFTGCSSGSHVPFEREISRISQSLCYDPCTPLYIIGVSSLFSVPRERRCSGFQRYSWASELIGSELEMVQYETRTVDQNKDENRREHNSCLWARKMLLGAREVKRRRKRMVRKINIIMHQSFARARFYYAETGFAVPLLLYFWYLFRLRFFTDFAVAIFI